MAIITISTPLTSKKKYEILPYNDKYFFDREDEIEEINRKIKAMLNNEGIDRRTVVFRGERGTGKTWLLLHLKRNKIANLSKQKIETLYINFDGCIEKQKDEFIVDYNKSLDDFLDELAQQWNLSFPSNATLQEKSHWLIDELSRRLSDKILVVFLDGISSASPAFLQSLEEYWLKYLAKRRDVLIIMSTRGEMYRWISPELRLFVESHELGPFSRGAISDYLERMERYLAARDDQEGLPHKADEAVYEAGGGFALSTYWLARYGPDQVDALIALLLEFIGDDKKRELIRVYLEALSVLNPWQPTDQSPRGFREEEMQRMLPAHPQLSSQSWPMPEVRRVRDTLQQYHLLRWDGDVGGYVIDAAIRYPIAYALRRKHPDIWQRLHAAAAQMYRGWGEKFARYRDYYDNLARLHSEQGPEAAATAEVSGP